MLNYVIGTWSGPRWYYPNGYQFNPLKLHLEHLQRLEHNIDLVTIGYPYNENESIEYNSYMRKLRDKGRLEDGTPIDVVRMVNRGLSYGQWGRIFEKYRSKFDHYILVEDDYLPVLDNLDTVLLDMCTGGYLCGLVFNESGRYGVVIQEHGAISNGIISAECLEATYKKFGYIPDGVATNTNSQITFTKAPREVGQALHEYIASGEYRSVFWDNHGIVIYGKSLHAKDIFIPVQYAIDPAKYQYLYVAEWSSRPTTYTESLPHPK